jgi:hypothetical protein
VLVLSLLDSVPDTMDSKDVAVDAHDNVVRPGSLVANMSPERRAQVEKSLKRKLDARCSLFVLIYIMNYLDRYVNPRKHHNRSW